MEFRTDLIISVKKLLTGAAASGMNINGSSTQAEYFYSPVNKTVLVSSMTLLLEDAGSTVLSSFGAISALTNGLNIEAIIGGQTYGLMNLKSNTDIITAFDWINCGNGAVDTLGSPNGFGNSVNWLKAHFHFEPQLLPLTNSDKIRAIVRDNLSGIGTLAMSIKIMESMG